MVIPKEIRWMLEVGMGFVAGAVFAYILIHNLNVQSEVDAQCGTCISNLNVMIGNFNTMTRECHLPNPYGLNLSRGG